MKKKNWKRFHDSFQLTSCQKSYFQSLNLWMIWLLVGFRSTWSFRTSSKISSIWMGNSSRFLFLKVKFSKIQIFHLQISESWSSWSTCVFIFMIKWKWMWVLIRLMFMNSKHMSVKKSLILLTSLKISQLDYF